MNKPLNAVINIDVKPAVLVERLSGRYICKNCGATYHKLYNPTKVPGTCDRCGGHEFFQRDDDKPATVKNRLKVNIEENTPLIDFYQKRGLLFTVNGDQDIDLVFADVQAVLKKTQLACRHGLTVFKRVDLCYNVAVCAEGLPSPHFRV